MKNVQKLLARAGVAAAAAVPAVSFAAVDVTEALAELSGGTAAVAALGGAALVIIAAAAVFRLVRRAV
ncbi:methyltransferase [Pseudomonas sp. ABC1]|uniref:major capsid protein n=1 Tax=Pseudomonas sp. ABC1 TaxID=2748080 RepID=UPI0015C2F822|nr:major capsid protein [Pseudomonas sp. ABC1]QLF92219.1 methyltransferase [Pseudomonas sp. ABC1]